MTQSNDGEIEQKASRAHRARQIRRWVWRIIMLVLALAVVAGIVFALQTKPLDVEMAVVGKGSMAVVVDEDGHTRFKDRHVVSAPLAGNLSRIELRPGDLVDVDTVVAELLPLPEPLLNQSSRAQAEARLAAAQASYKQAISNTARASADLEFAESQAATHRTLAAKGALTQQRLQRSELELSTAREAVASAEFGSRVAKNSVEVAKAALGRIGAKNPGDETMVLRSPVKGVVLEVVQQSKGVVGSGTPLLEIGNPDSMEIVVDVLTTDAVRIQAGAPATIVRWGGEGELMAHVRQVEPKAFGKMSSLGVEERRVNVLLELDSDKELWNRLGDGYRVETEIIVWQGADRITVPASAIFKHDDSWSVFVAEEGKARLRSVELGERSDLLAEIRSGLQVGETVILHPGEKVKEGVLVQAL